MTKSPSEVGEVCDEVSGEDFLSKNGDWLQRKSAAIATKYATSYDDVYQSLALKLLEGKSRRIAVLEVSKEIRRDGRVRSFTDEEEAALYDLEPSEDLLSDAESVLACDDALILRRIRAGHTQTEVGKELRISQQAVSERLKKIRRTIKEACE